MKLSELLISIFLGLISSVEPFFGQNKITVFGWSQVRSVINIVWMKFRNGRFVGILEYVRSFENGKKIVGCQRALGSGRNRFTGGAFSVFIFIVYHFPLIVSIPIVIEIGFLKFFYNRNINFFAHVDCFSTRINRCTMFRKLLAPPVSALFRLLSYLLSKETTRIHQPRWRSEITCNIGSGVPGLAKVVVSEGFDRRSYAVNSPISLSFSITLGI
mmetsp:Transcript_2549/g.5480  ORF Transcript_2549/g.5480 Transcript_2549/m.5480 type:complete len:215 (+) Transcript_2549:2444-3088(+)